MVINCKVNRMWQLGNAEKGRGVVKRFRMSVQEEQMLASHITRVKQRRDLIFLQ